MEELNSTQNQDKNHANSIVNEILDWAKYIIAAFVIAFLVSRFLIVNAFVPTESMVSTINPGDRLIANRLAYSFSKPQRGDIVVFKYPDDEKLTYVKRIIGLPGETLEVSNGDVLINGKPLDEPYIRDKAMYDFPAVKIPEGRYFMMGDNRNNSRDSRYWENKFVEQNKILGKALVRYFPFNRIKYLG